MSGPGGGSTRSGQVRVSVLLDVPEQEAEELRLAYKGISAALAGTAGLLGNELLRDTADPRAWTVMSVWRDLPSFRVWEDGPDHRAQTAPLRRWVRGARVQRVELCY
ncbi:MULTISPECIES: antibiotic biosynthesis monooxygenase [Streptomyces]|uniref:Antibiotic biosynthesis monooxygenase n=1 Tax=Streptomyces lycii TaxID=2654337 RepID=A0ABQ7FJS3_9ACTN|nr:MULTISPECIES: antibiotic biosynthesis monooxygenase family protein [Streptomyces]KAF4407482.1 antibiotic biosynthesis monooxygenase [Streptomyces lycii]PGH48348.1 antibiotic biosynthesis monooxygenase [Streptomyces sp. Ru87]